MILDARGSARFGLFATALIAAAGCRTGNSAPAPAVTSPSEAGIETWYDPSRDVGFLFEAVQRSDLFTDSKTFVDARPLDPPAEIAAAYVAAHADPGFSLQAFVARRFAPHVLPESEPAPALRCDGRSLRPRHRHGARAPVPRRARGRARVLDGRRRGPGPGQAHRRVLRLGDGPVLNRDWDDRADPRPESVREDDALGRSLPAADRPALYRNIRATAESGWDFSSRWMRDPGDLRTLETTRVIPVDLNSLLYHTERLIAALRRFRGKAGDTEVAERFAAAADVRRRALLAIAYDDASGFFYDVRWPDGARVTDRPTLAAAVPLYFGLASPAQGRAVADRLERDFLAPGGFVTTLVASGQQWDAPNGWPPLEWMAIEGVRRYGRGDLADTARARWLALNRRTYVATGRMMEKYDVVDLEQPAGGGEYPTQDGFGWTNGVALALLRR